MSTSKVEDILKKIHIVFAKGKSIGDNPDRIVLSKSEMFALLTELNEAMYEVLDKYEASTRAKEKAKLEMEKKASEIVIKARQDADDVHAASILYTDSMLAEISTAISDVTEAMKREYMLFLQRMDERQQALQEDRDEINNQLNELHGGDFYLRTLEECRKEEARALEEGDEEDEEEDNDKPALVKPNRKKNSQKEEIEPDEEWPEEEKPAPPVIRVNKPGENTGVQISTRHNRKRKQLEGMNDTPNDSLLADALDGMSDEQIEELENSIPAYGQGFTAEDFPNLDAEYEQFKQEQEGGENSSDSAPKKGLFGFLGKKGKVK